MGPSRGTGRHPRAPRGRVEGRTRSANRAEYGAQGWLTALSGGALLIAGASLMLLLATGRRDPILWMGVAAVLLGTAQLVHERRAPHLVLSESSISWSRGPVRPRLSVEFAAVLSWHDEGRKLVFATRDGRIRRIDLFSLSERDRDDVRSRLARCLGPPQRPGD